MFERILVPTDGSQCSRAAIQLATRIAKNDNSELFLCHVSAPPAAGSKELAPEDVLKKAAAETGAYPHTQTLLRQGRAVQEIIDAAKDKRADLIVMGSHGERGLPQLFLGSVAEGVLRTASVPVIIVPLEAARPRRTSAPPKVA